MQAHLLSSNYQSNCKVFRENNSCSDSYQLAKLIGFSAISERVPLRMRFEPVPVNVPVPPQFAAYATERKIMWRVFVAWLDDVAVAVSSEVVGSGFVGILRPLEDVAVDVSSGVEWRGFVDTLWPFDDFKVHVTEKMWFVIVGRVEESVDIVVAVSKSPVFSLRIFNF